jgi:cobalt-zinc-cadmium efflux system outer membrane protein
MNSVGNLRWAMALALGSLLAPAAGAEPALSLPDAIRFALEHNPEIATFRTQNGIAAAAVVIARTYPFNPIWQSYVTGVGGPAESGILNRVWNEHYINWQIEYRGQGNHRLAAARAAMSRSEWEVAARELDLTVRVARAFQAVVYQQEHLRLIQATVKNQESAVEQVTRLVNQGRLGRADLVMARGDLSETRATLGPAQTGLDQALYALRRLLGVVEEEVTVEGQLGATVPPLDAAAITRAALENRPDLHALRLAIEEAQARLRLEVANRFGNVTLGPFFELNETKDRFVGGSLNFPLPVCNTRRGEILQREAERDRSSLALRQGEVQVQEDIQAALKRLADAEATVQNYDQTLKDLDEMQATVDRLFAQADPGVGLFNVLDVRRRILRSRSLRVDALWELNQAIIDLAAAVGEPSVLCPPTELLPPPSKAR